LYNLYLGTEKLKSSKNKVRWWLWWW